MGCVVAAVVHFSIKHHDTLLTNATKHFGARFIAMDGTSKLMHEGWTMMTLATTDESHQTKIIAVCIAAGERTVNATEFLKIVCVQVEEIQQQPWKDGNGKPCTSRAGRQ